MTHTDLDRGRRDDTDRDRRDRSDAASTAGRYSRRHVVAAAVGTAAVGLTGCLGGDGGDAPAAVTLPEDATCDVCGMVIVQHPGPTAEIFYADQQPGGHDNPAQFDSTWEAFQFDFDHGDWRREAFYVTDYSTVDYEIRTDGDQQVISTHYDQDSFADATTMTFVAGSSVVGAMGEDLIGFADGADAESFQAEYGGDVVAFDDVSPELLSTLGQ